MKVLIPQKIRPWWPLVLAFAWVCATAGVRSLALPDEGRYVGIAWEMLRSHDWLTPRLDTLPYFHKPPLFYWITAAALHVFGNVEWAARLAPMLGAAIALASTRMFARRWFDERTANLALLALATQPLFYFGSQYANLDMLVAGCITATVFAFANAALSETTRRASLAAGYLFAALGVLAKGLIGAVLPGFVVVVWLLAMGRARRLAAFLWVPGLVLFLVITAPWFVAMEREFPGFFHYFFVVQHFSRFAGSGFNNVHPVWFYVAVLAVASLPWWPLAIRAALKPGASDRQVIGLAVAWIACITLFFSLPQSKLVGYILPVAAPIALLSAAAVRAASKRLHGTLRVATSVLATACVAGVFAMAGATPEHSTHVLANELASRMRAADEVVFLHGYWFDVPFYARLQRPVLVVESWAPAEVQSTDNWRRELADAGAFAPGRARSLLVDKIPVQVCGDGAIWVIGPTEDGWKVPELRGAEVIAHEAGKTLWHTTPMARTQASHQSCVGG